MREGVIGDGEQITLYPYFCNCIAVGVMFNLSYRYILYASK